MALYPSLENLKIDNNTKKTQINPIPQYPTIVPKCAINDKKTLYPQLDDYMGLALNDESIKNEIYSVNDNELSEKSRSSSTKASLSNDFIESQRTPVNNGIRELTLSKDKDGKIGLRVHAVQNGIFVCLVSPGSPAIQSGLRFGDQILEVNGTSVAGFSMEQAHKIFQNAPANNIKIVVRDRPFERTIVMHKDSSGQIGFQFKEGKIISVVKDSSAAKNGLLTDHQILEVNGKNVIGLKDKDIVAEIKKSSDTVIINVIPTYIFEHIVKNMAGSLLKLMNPSGPSL
ncbi:syntenin-1-like isoform X2 [Chelonus insularis]|uniref:syntenin-1-like isoform X2 n=1 Tax=Chelonus insularis TaxID=460826 RepID=UPI00158AFE6B|nr:syntenin-1-like isoform X2 [Chelonus insularis]